MRKGRSRNIKGTKEEWEARTRVWREVEKAKENEEDMRVDKQKEEKHENRQKELQIRLMEQE